MHNPILKCKKFSILLLSCIFLIASVVTAQSQTVSGTVTGSVTNEGINGASIKVKNTLKGVPY
jgi:hypothetical protein